jgi:hypothetical protein
MTMTNKILAGVLAVQIALGALTWMPSGEGPTEAVDLVSFKLDAITELEVTGRVDPASDEAPEKVHLRKEGAHWALISSEGYPADPSKVETVLTSLSELQVRRPIATQAANHATLDVSDTKNTRRVVVKAGAEQVELLLGAATGQAANVRRAGSDDVFAVRGVSAWSIGDTARRYFEASYAKSDKDEVNSFTVKNAQGTHTFLRAGGLWSEEGLPEGATLHQLELDALANTLLNVRLSDVVGKGAKPEHGFDGGARVEWTITEDGGTSTFGYTVGALADGKRFVKADDKDFVVSVLESGVQRAVETDFAFIQLDGSEASEEG